MTLQQLGPTTDTTDSVPFSPGSASSLFHGLASTFYLVAHRVTKLEITLSKCVYVATPAEAAPVEAAPAGAALTVARRSDRRSRCGLCSAFTTTLVIALVIALITALVLALLTAVVTALGIYTSTMTTAQ